MTDRELMQQALDALESGLTINDRDSLRWTKAIEALRAALANEFNPDWDAMAVMVEEQQRMAKRIEELKERLLQVELKPSTARLAQPEQEPVAWELNEVILDSIHDSSEVVAPPQREWQGLTAYEIQELHFAYPHFGNFACAIEAELKEKNAPNL